MSRKSEQPGGREISAECAQKVCPYPAWSRDQEPSIGTSVPTQQLWGAEQGSDHLPPGLAEIQGHRPGTRERQEHITDNKMARGKQKSIPQVNQENLTTLEPSSPITANSGMQKIPEKEDSDLKSNFKMMIEILKQEWEKT